MKNKITETHSDNKWAKGVIRYILIENILDSNSWSDLEDSIEKEYGSNNCKEKMELLFNEFKFYNCVLKIEYFITDLLNDFLIKESKIKNWEKLKDRFLEKVKTNKKISEEEAKKIIEKERNGKMKNILTPYMMLEFAGFGVGELINYVSEFTNSFPEKKKLVKKLTEFNESRKVVIHTLLSSRKDVEEKIEKGIVLCREISELINEIINGSCENDF